MTPLGIVEIIVQRRHSSGSSFVNINVRRFDRGDQHRLFSSPCNRNVQSAFTARFVQWSKIQSHLTLLIATIAYAEHHNVAFVALHVLQVLDEETFQSVLFEESFKLGFFSQAAFNRFFHGLHLSYAEGYYAESFVRMVPEMVENETCNDFRFFRIVPQTSSIVDAVFNVTQFNAESVVLCNG